MLALAKMKVWIIALFLVLGAILHWQQGLASAWFLYVVSGLILLMHLLMGNVMMSWQLLRSGQPAEADRLLNSVWQPNWLLPYHRAYYFFSKGLLHVQAGQEDRAVRQLSRALQLPLKPDQSRGLALLNLAHLSLKKGERQTAKAFIQQLEKLELNDLKIKDQVAHMKRQLD